MNTNYKEIVYDCYDYGMPVEECLNVLNTEFGWNDYESPDYQQRLADFGRTYLDTILPQEKQEEILDNVVAKDHWYYEDYQATLEFVKRNR
jgi:hypothetical protein